MLKEKMNCWVESIKKIGGEDSTENEKKGISLSTLTFMPFGVWIYNIKTFAVLSCIFAPLIAILSFATNNSIACSYSEFSEQLPFRCDNLNLALYVAFFLLRLLLICVFLKSWYRVAIKHEHIFVGETLLVNVQDWKLFSTIVLGIVICMLPVLSLVLLIVREPNPNWIIESFYFAFVSVGFVLPLFAVRFYCIIAFVLANNKLPSFSKIFKLTTDNGLKLLISISVLALFCSLLLLYFSNVIESLLPINFLLVGILGEILYDVVLLAILTLVINYAIVQKYEIFKGGEN